MYNNKLIIFIIKKLWYSQAKKDLHYRRINPSTTRHGRGCFNILKLVNEALCCGTRNLCFK